MAIYPRPFQPVAGEAGPGNVAAWQNLTLSDVSMDLGGYTTATLNASAQAGYELNINQEAELGVSTNTFPINSAVTVYYDTGIDVDSLDNGDLRTITVQTMVELYDVSPTSDYITDTTYIKAVCPFMCDGAPPFTAGTAGMFAGSGFRAGSTAPQRMASRLLRNTATSSAFGTMWNGAADTLLSISNELTIAQGYPSSVKRACLFRYDSIGYWNNSGVDSALFNLNDTLYDSNNSQLSSSLHIGVAFHINNTVGAGVFRDYDFNIKYRVLEG